MRRTTYKEAQKIIRLLKKGYKPIEVHRKHPTLSYDAIRNINSCRTFTELHDFNKNIYREVKAQAKEV